MARMNKLTPGRIQAGVLIALSVWVVHDFIEALLAACVIATASWPLYASFAARVARRLGRDAAAVLFTGALTVFVLAPLVFAGWALATEAHALLLGLAAADGTPVALPGWLVDAPVVGRWIASHGKLDDLLLPQRTEPAAILGLAQSLGQFTARHVLTVGFAILLLCFFYRHGSVLAGALTRALGRGLGEQSGRYVQIATRAVRASVGSMLVVGLFDGLATAGAFALSGAPRPLVWGAITGALAAVPFLGYLAVAALVAELALQGAASAALLSLLLGCAVLLCGDKIVRPMVAREGIRLPFVWVLMACIGGFGVLGLAGLVVGPVVLSLAREMGEQWIGQP